MESAEGQSQFAEDIGGVPQTLKIPQRLGDIGC
jgi:hypothetical protein